MSRYVITLSDNNGGSNCYGAFGLKRAKCIFDQLLDVCEKAGTNDETELSVELHAIQRWPGIRAIREQVSDDT